MATSSEGRTCFWNMMAFCKALRKADHPVCWFSISISIARPARLPARTIFSRLVPDFWSITTMGMLMLEKLCTFVTRGCTYILLEADFSTSAHAPLCAGFLTVDVRSIEMCCLVIDKNNCFYPCVVSVDCFLGEAAASTWH